MQETCRLILLLGSITVVAFALEESWNVDSSEPAVASSAEQHGAAWRYTKYGWQDMREWRNVQAEVEPTPPAVHPLLWALGVLISSLAAMIWIGDSTPEEKPVHAELRRQRILNQLK